MFKVYCIKENVGNRVKISHIVKLLFHVKKNHYYSLDIANVPYLNNSYWINDYKK